MACHDSPGLLACFAIGRSRRTTVPHAVRVNRYVPTVHEKLHRPGDCLDRFQVHLGESSGRKEILRTTVELQVMYYIHTQKDILIQLFIAHHNFDTLSAKLPRTLPLRDYVRLIR